MLYMLIDVGSNLEPTADEMLGNLMLTQGHLSEHRLCTYDPWKA